ncbi:MAG: phosphoglucosamine mutase [Eubacteriales bacterium]|nr:phosphoglucosamine mutase [Eubacteriales bacterium]
MGKYFGTDGVRGEAGRALSAELAFHLGRAAAQVFRNERKSEGPVRILIGRDSRLSGQMFEAALSAGLTACGAEVLLCGMIPTPGLSYLLQHCQADAAAMISASHNPYLDNGIKFFNRKGAKIADDLELKMETYLDHPSAIEDASGAEIRHIQHLADASQRYEDFLASKAEAPYQFPEIVIDCANGAASEIAQRLFPRLGLNCHFLACEPNGLNINSNCGSTHMETLCRVVRERKAACGLAFDGDADRFLVCDEAGEVFDGDHLLCLFADHFFLQKNIEPKRIVVTVMSNLGFHKAMAERGIEVLATQVGDRYVHEAMLESDSLLGGEQSGHLIFRSHQNTGDGLLSALMLLNCLKERGVPLSELNALMSSYPQYLLNVPCSKKSDPKLWSYLESAISEAEASLDGKGRILVRASGTEELVRVMTEAEDASLAQRLAEEMAAKIEAYTAD